ncbi:MULTISPECIES: DUF2510 domain-containing protein [Mumia]|uniref:DUF2510 domain-containing protein n=1 Tax=Mumia TaxID=1546255 RepID=UPI00141DA90C|nr:MULTISPECIES: DUF2510 domain-containing protein [unclassified Mumia]QMW67422.1 DUF2510 domain-containing protein [Mumia sp. ZJ1417]
MRSRGTPRAGWYPDPKDEALFRYWDGASWTTRTSSEPRDPHAPRRRPAALVAAALLALFALGVLGAGIKSGQLLDLAVAAALLGAAAWLLRQGIGNPADS